MTPSGHFVAPLELGICVTDPERMAAFYVAALGCAEVGRAVLPAARTSEIGLGDGDVTIVWLQTATGERIKLLRPASAPGATGAQPAHLTAVPGVAYLTFHVDDLRKRALDALAAGATAMTGTLIHESASGVTISFFRDPEGNVVELVERADLRAYRADL